MRIVETPARTAVLAVSALSMVACLETTAPVDILEVRVAHAAPGLGTQTVLMEGLPVFELQSLQTVFFPLESQSITYAFAAEADTIARHVAQHEQLNAIVLMNPGAPTVHHFPLERRLFQVRIMVINGDFSTTEPLTVRIEKEGFEFEESIAPGGHAIIEPDAGTFQLSARPAGSDAFTPIESFALLSGDNGFLIIVPHPDPGIAYGRLLF